MLRLHSIRRFRRVFRSLLLVFALVGLQTACCYDPCYDGYYVPPPAVIYEPCAPPPPDVYLEYHHW